MILVHPFSFSLYHLTVLSSLPFRSRHQVQGHGKYLKSNMPTDSICSDLVKYEKQVSTQLELDSEALAELQAKARSDFQSAFQANPNLAQKPIECCVYKNCFKRRKGLVPFCVRHGGGYRCGRDGCNKLSVSNHASNPLCIQHGGDYSTGQCQWKGCDKVCKGPFCAAHRKAADLPPLVIPKCILCGDKVRQRAGGLCVPCSDSKPAAEPSMPADEPVYSNTVSL